MPSVGVFFITKKGEIKMGFGNGKKTITEKDGFKISEVRGPDGSLEEKETIAPDGTQTYEEYWEEGVLEGRSMVNIMTTASELGYITFPDNILIDIEQMRNAENDALIRLNSMLLK